mgnify:CR=1 FL=1
MEKVHPRNRLIKIIDSTDEMFEFHKAYMLHAYRVAHASDDPSTQVGAVIVSDQGVVAQAYNKPISIKDTTGLSKYDYTEHAERRVLYECISKRLSPKGCSMYANWASCCDCARAVIECGIDHVYTHLQMHDKYSGAYRESTEKGLLMLTNSGVNVTMISGDISNGRITIRTSGQNWQP